MIKIIIFIPIFIVIWFFCTIIILIALTIYMGGASRFLDFILNKMNPFDFMDWFVDL